MRLGFLHPAEITAATTSTLCLRSETDPVAYKMVVPNSGGKEYFLFENRQSIGFDQGSDYALRHVHGLAIYHVDDTVFSRTTGAPTRPRTGRSSAPRAGARRGPARRTTASRLIQADDRWDLEHGATGSTRRDSSLSGDLYPGTLHVTSFGSYTRPNSSSYYFWGGSEPKYGYSGVTATNIAGSRRRGHREPVLRPLDVQQEVAIAAASGPRGLSRGARPYPGLRGPHGCRLDRGRVARGDLRRGARVCGDRALRGRHTQRRRRVRGVR